MPPLPQVCRSPSRRHPVATRLPAAIRHRRQYQGRGNFVMGGHRNLTAARRRPRPLRARAHVQSENVTARCSSSFGSRERRAVGRVDEGTGPGRARRAFRGPRSTTTVKGAGNVQGHGLATEIVATGQIHEAVTPVVRVPSQPADGVPGSASRERSPPLRRRRHVVAEFDLLGTKPGRSWDAAPPIGRFRVAVIEVFMFDGDRITNERVYLDSAAFCVRLVAGSCCHFAGRRGLRRKHRCAESPRWSSDSARLRPFS